MPGKTSKTSKTSKIEMTERDAFLAIERDLNARFVARSREIRGLILALLSGEHALLLGPPGTGKSALALAFAESIEGASFFQWLLTRFSSPEELFGPVSLSGLKSDRYERVVDGKLPCANVAFLDEIFKANSAILNALLTALNERAFDNGTTRMRIPLETVIGASNELPEDDGLGALHDRFIMRYWVDYTSSADEFARLITGKGSTDHAPTGARVTLAQLASARTAVASIDVDGDTVAELFTLRQALKGSGIVASDRRWRKMLRLLQAQAWLDGESAVTSDQFPMVADMVWETRKQIEPAREVCSQFASAEVAEAERIAEMIRGLVDGLPHEDASDYAARAGSVVREMKRAEARLQDMMDSATRDSVFEKLDAVHASVVESHKSVARAARASLGF